jgi:hypothetical protein
MKPMRSLRFMHPLASAALVVFTLALTSECRGRQSQEAAAAAPEAVPASADEWRVEWVQSRVPETMPRSSSQDVQATFRNAGSRGMANDNLSISYHWFAVTPAGPKQAIWDGIRTPVTIVLAPGGSFSSSVRVQTPDQPGDYLLVIDLVRDGVSWFQYKGAPQLTHPVTIL